MMKFISRSLSVVLILLISYKFNSLGYVYKVDWSWWLVLLPLWLDIGLHFIVGFFQAHLDRDTK